MSSENPFLKISDAALKRGLKVAVWGPQSSGKTHFALSFPQPIYVIDTELGSTPLRKKFKDKDINVLNVVSVAQDSTGVEADDVADFEEVLKGINYLLDKPIEEQKGTIVIDSSTDLWSMIQGYGKTKMYKLKPTDRLKSQFDWAPITKLHTVLLKRLLKSPYNIVLTGKSGEVFDGPVNTGEPVGRFQKDVPYLCDVVLHMEKRYVNKELTRVGVIEKCRMNGALDGQILASPSYNTLAKAITMEE
jgi:KaiC/GvpD/RAD55 family RecA-like ATPase